MQQEKKHNQASGMKHHHYRHLAAMTVQSFLAMYILMYAMVDRFANVFNNVNQVYMAGLMAAPMLLIELLVMRSMYPQRGRNIAIGIFAAVAMIGFWSLIRAQGGVRDAQFLRSMIPHHSGAVLMCRKASLQDAAIRKLCGEIVESQEREIAQMKVLLANPR